MPAELDTIQLCSARLLEAVNYIFWAKEEEKEQKHRWEDSQWTFVGRVVNEWDDAPIPLHLIFLGKIYI